MKSFLRTFLLTGVPLGVFWGFYFGAGKESSAAIWQGIVAGLLFGLVVASLARYRQNRVSGSPPLFADELPLREGRATHDGMSGWLYVTNRRMLFEGYPTDETAPEISRLFEGGDAIAEPTHQVSIPLLRISDVVISHPLGVNSRLDIVLTDGRTEYFETEDLADWIDDISTARQRYLDEPRGEDMKLFAAPE